MNTRAFLPVDKATFFRFASQHDDQRFEYENGRIVQQMTGSTRDHAMLFRRFANSIEEQIDHARFVVLQEHGVELPDAVRYPDVVVGPADEPGKGLATLRPVLIVEILSPSSVARDLDVKPQEYLRLPSLEAYIVASQDEPACLIWRRNQKRNFPKQPLEVNGRELAIIVEAL